MGHLYVSLSSLAKDYKKRPKRSKSEAEIFNQDLKDLKEVCLAFECELPTRSTKSALAKIIMKIVEQKCPDECLKLVVPN